MIDFYKKNISCKYTFILCVVISFAYFIQLYKLLHSLEFGDEYELAGILENCSAKYGE